MAAWDRTRGWAALAVAGCLLVPVRSPADCSMEWMPAGAFPGLDGTVHAVTGWDPDGAGPAPELVVVGGNFATAGNVSANHIAAWDGTQWLALNGGVDGEVRALSVFDGQLIAGGGFMVAGGISAKRVAKWNGAIWAPLGSGMNDAVSALTVYNSQLLAGGDFSTAGGAHAEHVAKWNGAGWSAVNGGVDGAVYALAVHNGMLVAGGSFSHANSLPAQCIARWSGSGWSALDDGLNGVVRALSVHNGLLVAGGDFTAAGSTAANHVAAWDGASWAPLAAGVADTARALAVHNGSLVVGGQFLSAGDASAKYIAQWDGTAWSAVGDGTNGAVRALGLSAGDLMAAGEFTCAGEAECSHVARWNGAAWGAVGAGLSHEVWAWAVHNGELIAAGGGFVAGVWTGYVVRRSGETWIPLGSGMNEGVETVAVYDGNLIAGGSFTMAGGVSINRIARWSGTEWTPLGAGMNDDVLALEVYNGALIAGGRFTTAGGHNAQRIASWDGNGWTVLGEGLRGGEHARVAALAVFGGELMVGGEFDTAGAGSAHHVARWNGADWAPLGDGLSGAAAHVNALAVYHGELAVGGAFDLAGGSPAGCVAGWNGATWRALSNGVGGVLPIVEALRIYNGELVAAGSFTSAGGGAANHIARWNGSGWAPLGSGLAGSDPYVFDLAVLDDELMAGGRFTIAGERVSPYWARWVAVGQWPLIIQQPSDQWACLGAPASLTIVAEGTPPISFQWRKNGVNISGATSDVYTIAAAGLTDAGSYDCELTNPCGWATSAAATLSVIAGPSVAEHPASTTQCVGAPVTFRVIASGTPPLSYQWRKDGADIPGATGSVYALSAIGPDDAGTYDCVVTDVCAAVTSAGATLTVAQVPLITEQPESQTRCLGQAVTFHVFAYGIGGLSFQWRHDGANISGATSNLYTIDVITPADAGPYDVVVTDMCGSTTSTTATLTIGVAVSITEQPQSQTTCAGQAVVFQVTADGAPPVEYQWRKDGASIAGATSSTYAVGSVTVADAGSYDCMVSNGCGAATSTAAALMVNTGPLVTDQPDAQAVCAGGLATFALTASGTPPISYQWRRNGADISGATASSYTVGSVTPEDAGEYDCVVTNACSSTTSTVAALAVHTGPVILAEPEAQTACIGSLVTFTVSASAVPPPTYQWRHDGVAINGASEPVYTIGAVQLADAGSYDVTVANPCGTISSSAAALSVDTGPAIIVQPSSQAVCYGGAVTFHVAATGVPPPTYQWRKDGAPLAGATNATLPLDSVTPGDAGCYDVVLQNRCGTVTSASATLTVNESASIATQPESQAVCSGSPVTFRVSAAGTPPFGYQWRKDGVSIAGAVGATYTLDAAWSVDVGEYDVVVANACGLATSASAALTIGGGPVVADPPHSQSVCIGSSVTLSAMATGVPPLSYQWYQNGAPIGGATEARYTIASLAPADVGSYDVLVANPCGSTRSAAASLTSGTGPVIVGQPQAQSVCRGSAASFAVAVQGAPPLWYQWQKDGADVPGPASNTLTIAAAGDADAGWYSVVVTGRCGVAASIPVALDVFAGPSIVEAPQSQTIRGGLAATFRVVVQGAGGLRYQWRKNGAVVSGPAGDVYTLASVGIDDTGTYDVVVISSCGTTTSVAATLAVTPSTPDLPQPAAEATEVPIDMRLDWGDTYGATSYDVHFDTAMPPAFRESTTVSAWSPGTLAPSTRYFWWIVAKNGSGNSGGPVWSFTTDAAAIGGELRASGRPAAPAVTDAGDTSAVSPDVPDGASAEATDLAEPEAGEDARRGCGVGACGGGLVGYLAVMLLWVTARKLQVVAGRRVAHVRDRGDRGRRFALGAVCGEFRAMLVCLTRWAWRA